MQSVFLEDIDAETYAAYVTQPHATLIIPTGATEQHGPHMPLGVCPTTRAFTPLGGMGASLSPQT